MSKSEFDGKNALVTGVGSGIGLETARQLAEGGARIIGVDRNEQKLKEAVSSLARHTPPHVGVVKDLRSGPKAKTVVQEALMHVDYIDIVVNAAGVCYFTKFSEISE